MLLLLSFVWRILYGTSSSAVICAMEEAHFKVHFGFEARDFA